MKTSNNTILITGGSAGIGGHRGIPASQVADHLLKALGIDEFEIRVGNTKKQPA